MAQENTKLEYLNKLEEKGKALKAPNKNVIESADENAQKPKFFITFPYPYMNGKLHLGHLYSISKADIFAYYKEMNDYNVLFPFAFHCTGMPIAASAQKLQQELNGNKVDVSVIGILKSIGFTLCEDYTSKDESRLCENDECICKFTDPYKWCRTFPKYCIESLKKFDANIDWRRSFITTEINAYYDSFVRWQFKKLQEKGFINFGKRYSIYCPVDKQACLDHDRRKGEGIKPVLIALKMLENNVLVRLKDFEHEIVDGNELVTSKAINWVKVEIEGVVYFMEELYYNSIKEQVTNTKLLEEVEDISKIYENTTFLTSNLDLKESKLKMNNKNKTTENKEIVEFMNNFRNEEMKLKQFNGFVFLQVPEDTIISRSGGLCTVALMDQWFLDYSNSDWKAKARRCIAQMECNAYTRQKLEFAVEWINKWGFSRSFGLGTKFFKDEKVLIDSLSDSTVYMAFYTVKHLMFTDLEGKDEIFNKADLCENVWDFIFFGKTISNNNLLKNKESMQILEDARKQFEYFYPVDLRVSGKDLINNHLIFFIMNHVAIFDEKYWPKRIFTNGHLMLNSAKMSKSEGNFLTVDDALKNFGTSATRMCLLACGDTNEDANFVESMANSFVLKLYTLSKNILNSDSEVSNNVHLKFDKLEKYLISCIKNNRNKVMDAYENMIFRDVLKYEFYDNLAAIETYDIISAHRNTSNNNLKAWAYLEMVKMLYPAIPNLSRYLQDYLKNYKDYIPNDCVTHENNIDGINYVKEVIQKLNAKKGNLFEIIVAKKYTPWKESCMLIIDNVVATTKKDVKKQILKECGAFIKENKKKAPLFCMDYLKDRTKYVVEFDEIEYLTDFKSFIEKETNKKITITQVEQHEKSEPGNPFIKDP